MSARVDKVEQAITVELLPNDVGRWRYAITATATGRFPWLRGFAATAMRYKPYNFEWEAPEVELVTAELRQGAYFVMVYFRPNAILPGTTFRVEFGFDLTPTWDSRRLRFYERIMNDARTSVIRFVLPPGYKLKWANVMPDRTYAAEDGRQVLEWSMTMQGATYEFDFTLMPEEEQAQA